MTDALPSFTPVTLLTGFLGSGKTSLLQSLLADPALADTAVLINEFGEVALDHHLLERIDDRTILLKSGCLCCTVRGELADALRDLHSRRARGSIPRFRRVVIESTGLADPFPVLTTLHADPVLKHHFRMASVITTVDAVAGARTLAAHSESVKQLAVADRIVLTKTDLADAGTIAAIMRRVRAINPAAPILLRSEIASQITALFADGAARDDTTQEWIDQQLGVSMHGHVDGITAFAIVFDHSIDWTGFSLWLTMLLNRHGDAVLRVKGILNVAGSDTPVAIHGVQHLVHAPTHMQAWPDGDRRSRLVFIVQGLDPDAIKASFGIFCGRPRDRKAAA
jgi:G3E family GTPase